jgi:hypothetical protein
VKRIWCAAGVGLLGVLLSACAQGASSPSPTGGPPPIPSSAEVHHPAAPGGAPVYLNLLTDAEVSLYQVPVGAGSTRTRVNPAGWRGKEAGLTRPIGELLPEGANAGNANVVLAHWLVWQDKNTNGTRDEGETLPLMTHDRYAYASAAVQASFQTLTPDMVQSWQLESGWTRLEHYVYRPLDSQTYRRSLTTNGIQIFELHEPTPVTSM